jgi:hypothetical protein
MKRKGVPFGVFLMMLIMALLVGIVITGGCKTITENLISITAQPAEVQSGGQVILTVSVLNQSTDGYTVQFKPPSGRIVGGNVFRMTGPTVTAIFEPEIYAGTSYRLDIVYAEVFDLKGILIGETSTTIKVKKLD